MPCSPLEEFDEDDEGNPKSDILKNAQNYTEDKMADSTKLTHTLSMQYMMCPHANLAAESAANSGARRGNFS